MWSGFANSQWCHPIVHLTLCVVAMPTGSNPGPASSVPVLTQALRNGRSGDRDLAALP